MTSIYFRETFVHLQIINKLRQNVTRWGAVAGATEKL